MCHFSDQYTYTGGWQIPNDCEHFQGYKWHYDDANGTVIGQVEIHGEESAYFGISATAEVIVAFHRETCETLTYAKVIEVLGVT